jgi:hypothetical protein
MICQVDIYALLCSNGSGTFIEALLKHNLLPAPENCLPPVSPNHSAAVSPEERPYFPALIRLNQEVLLLALQVGQMARVLRAEATQRRWGDPAQMTPEVMFTATQRTRIQNLHHLMEHSRDKWRTQFPGYGTWLNDPSRLPRRVFAMATHV